MNVTRMPKPAPTIVWFRQDLRLRDHAALRAAAARGPVLPVYLWSPDDEGRWPAGGASRWWLRHSLAALDKDLRKRGSRLVVREGGALMALRKLVQESGADAIYFSRRYEPAARKLEADLVRALAKDGVEARGFGGALLFEPDAARTLAGGPFQVFTPYWRACLRLGEPATPESAPATLLAPSRWPASTAPKVFAREPHWAGGMAKAWTPGEAGAAARLRSFKREALASYARGRDAPGEAGTSRLSPHLHFGECSPRQVWHAVREAEIPRGEEPYLRQIVWREFAHHLLWHFPHTPERPLRAAFSKFPWARAGAQTKRQVEAWRRGRTGYPIVDAGMRELWATGWMHNRVRMIVASFLVKDLLVSWNEGAAWFWETLADADLANNTLGWQWTAGCGADAAPYFRVFNPISQGEKFDAAGEYVRRWAPELAKLPDRWLHRPWEAPDDVLRNAKVKLGETYPRPIVDHGLARGEALAAFAELKRR